MGTNTLQSLQHFVAFYSDTTVARMKIRHDGIPDGMSVEHCSRAALFYDADVQRAFVGRFGYVVADDLNTLVDQQDLLWEQLTLIDAARAHGKTQWFTLDDSTQVPTSAK